MTIVSDFPVLQRPWKGYDDPGLPVGMWIAQGTQLGDASGGLQAVIFTFKAEGEPLGARFFNIEQIEMHTTEVTANAAGISLENFDVISSQGLVNRLISVQLNTDGITNSGLRPVDLTPIFLGRPQLVGISAQVLTRTANINGETFFVTMQGYIWEPRSLLAPGGLRRPLDSLYGT